MNKKNMSKISYKGKDIFIGIDVHKKTYSAVARVDGEAVKKWTIVASPTKFSQQLLKYFKPGNIHTVYGVFGISPEKVHFTS